VTWCDTELWIADAEHSQIAAVTINGAGRWLAQGLLKRPAGLAYCPANQLCYVVDAAAHAVIALDKSGSPMHQFGTRGAGPGQFNFPTHVAVSNDGWLAVCDSLNFRVQRFGLDGSFINTFGRKGDAAGDLALPKGIAIDAAGNLWIADAHFENIQAFTPEGQLLMALGQEGQEPGQFWLPAGLAIDQKQRLWVADTYNRRVQAFELLP
jgi:sugar lactone lactonase YvrE